MSDRELFRFLEEMAPFFIAVLSIILLFLYLTIKAIFSGSRRERRLRKKDLKSKDEMTYDERLDDVIRRAVDLQHRVQIIEEIVHEDRGKH